MSVQRLAIVTGASKGIGRAICKQLIADDWRCLIVGRDTERLKQVLASVSGNHDYIAIDVTEQGAASQIARKASTMGGASLLVNNAGVNTLKPFAAMTALEIDLQIQTNLLAPMLLSQACLSQLSRHQGTIVNVGSAFGSIGFPYQTAYCASKFGLRGFSEALSRELDGQIDVKCLAPRATTTEMNDDTAVAVNEALGASMDPPDVVACAFMKLLKSHHKRLAVGFPEKLFARLNGLLPEVVDSALIKKAKTIVSILSTKESV
ncbi:SDR family oxidoreductase (plasmid) [Pseudoalteromonas sp. T1lg65]|uniref:SDR family oxidoreductase n=1 Tax=Pseudoalteromonas sp. T1lg65 TaxID=2077101 RepID=UPI003F79265C